MSSLEFQILLETARTNWKEPNLPWGGKPETTAQDVQQAYSMITHPYGTAAIKARYSFNEYSICLLTEWMRSLSWDMWPEHKHLNGTRITHESLCRVGELAVLDYISPSAVSESIEQRASICCVGKAAWNNYIRYHRVILYDHLTGIEGRALRQMYEFLYSD